jgi:transposase
MGDNRLKPLVLSEDERPTLENWVRRRSTAQGLALRARIVLACADGGSNTTIAARLGVNFKTVIGWRARFLRDRLDGLTDDPRPGVPRTVTDAQVEQVVVRTLEEVPEGATHWSKRELARQAGISPSCVLRIWRAFGLQPWRTETFKISPDPLLIDKIRDVVGLYLAPPANAVVFAVDEKPQIQALQRTAPVLPMLPGAPERRSFDYVRHGTVDLFAALNTATGKVISKLSAQHRAVGFRDFLDQIDCQAESGLMVHVICDNLSTHKAPVVHRWLAAHPRFCRYSPYVHGQQAAALATRQAAGVSSGAQRGPRAVHADQDQRRAVGTGLEVRRWEAHQTIVPVSPGDHGAAAAQRHSPGSRSRPPPERELLVYPVSYRHRRRSRALPGKSPRSRDESRDQLLVQVRVPRRHHGGREPAGGLLTALSRVDLAGRLDQRREIVR